MESLECQLETLRESEQRFRQIAENTREVLWIATPDGSEILYINPAYEKIWGRSCASLYAQPKSFLDAIHPEDRSCIFSGINSQLHEDYIAEYRIIRPDGTLRWVQSHGFPIRNQAGEVYRFAGLVEDITERKLAEAEIKQLNEYLELRVKERTAQLEAANQELDSFCYSVSHDLRAPLRHISGFVDALRQQLERNHAVSDPKVARYINVIKNSTDKMGSLIDALLNLSRLARKPLLAQSVDLRALVDRAIALVSSQTEFANRQICFEIGDLPTVTGDLHLLQQVFTNLIDNAVKFSRGSCPTIIQIGILPNYTIFVKDNGVGFQMAYADQLFGAFQRLHSQTEFRGTGIGLAIAQRIIHRHGSTIWAESQPNQGATFYFKLGQGH